MQFKVPQNVQREDTIVGPLTLKQLIILGAGGGLAYTVYISLSQSYFIEVWLPPTAIIAGLTLAFTFLKINNRPFHLFLMSFIEYHMLPKKRTWIQGSGNPPIVYQEKKKDDTPRKIEAKMEKSEKSLEELTSMVDKFGKSDLAKRAEELSKEKPIK